MTRNVLHAAFEARLKKKKLTVTIPHFGLRRRTRYLGITRKNLFSRKKIKMCRNIKTLHNFKPPATETEIRASSIQFVRKLSGMNKPSKANEEAFNQAIEKVAAAATELLDSLVTSAPPRDREVEAAKAKMRSAERFGSPQPTA